MIKNNVCLYFFVKRDVMLNNIYTELSNITAKQDVYIFPESTAPQDHGTFVHISICVYCYSSSNEYFKRNTKY